VTDVNFDSPGGRFPKWLIWGVGGGLFFGVLLLSLALATRDKEESIPTVEVGNNLLDSSFFNYLRREQKPEEPVKPPEPEVKVIYKDRIINNAGQVVDFVPNTGEPIEIKPTVSQEEKPPADLSTEEMFEESFNPTEELRAQLRSQLVGTGGAQFSHRRPGGDIQYKKVLVNNNTNKNWDSFGSPSDYASYPVDMQRVITNDMYIRCTLIDAIYSEMEGRVTCRITYNIYGAQGRLILIPAGSVAVGYHGTIEAVGNTRIPVNWTQVTTPQGIRINFAEEVGSSDSVGRAGITGKIDRKYDEKYGAALLISAVSVLTNLQVARSLDEGIEIDNLTNSLDEISKQIIKENADIQPVLLAGQGKTILLKPTTDIWFQEPCGYDVQLIPVSEKDNQLDVECEQTKTP
jgi:type IV secretory pathway VirB10-like protein